MFFHFRKPLFILFIGFFVTNCFVLRLSSAFHMSGSSSVLNSDRKVGSEPFRDSSETVIMTSVSDEENIRNKNEQQTQNLLGSQRKTHNYTIIRYISDVHAEHNNIEQMEAMQNKIQFTQAIDGQTISEVLVLAGDIGNPYLSSYTSFLKNMDSKFNKIFLLAGNHEYYSHQGRQELGESIDQTNAYIQHLCDTQFQHITFLNDKVELYNSIYFVGTTQWGDLSKTNTAVHQINDAHWIKDMTPERFTSLYQQSVHFLDTSLQYIAMNKTPSESVVVITHHQPSHRVIAAKYLTPQYLPYSGWFAGSLDDLMEKYDYVINCWIYGHTHDPSVMRLSPRLKTSPEQIASPDGTTATTEKEKEMSRCWYVCNPVGYPKENSVMNFEARVTIVHNVDGNVNDE